MIFTNFFHDLRAFVALIIELLWQTFAFLMDGLVAATPFQIALGLLILLGVLFGLAQGMQNETNKKLSKPQSPPINPLRLELRHSLLGVPFRALSFILTLPLHLLSALFSSKKDGRDKEAGSDDERPPLLIPSLGPSYVWAALICAGLSLLSILFEPLLRWQLDAPAHFPTWQFLLLGHRPELAPFLPLQTYPFAATGLITASWLLIWFTTARLVRLFHFEFIGKNIIHELHNPRALSSWRTHFGLTNLAEKDPSFSTWARWLPLIAVPFLGLAYIATGGDPYRVNPQTFALAFLSFFAWLLHLRLQGVYRPQTPPAQDEPQREPATAAGWPHVIAHLRRLHQISPPALSRPPRDVETLAFSRQDLTESQLISPLLTELLPAPNLLTAMQADVLTHLSHHSFVHVDPPSDTRTLELGAQDHPEQTPRHRNQIVIAPEGAGKSTLAMLAAFNTALTHTRSSLLILRDKESAKKTAAHLQELIQPSTLRWNLRVRYIGGDLIEDLAAGIIPDLLVCSLQDLVTTILEDGESYGPFLNNLALIIIDDVESFCGPIETHAQLAMRRLTMRLKALRAVDQDDQDGAPLFLVLASDTMDELPSWARSLCGTDAIPRYFSSQLGAAQREFASTTRQDVDRGGRRPSKLVDHPKPDLDDRRRQHLIYSIDAFKKASLRPLTALEIVEACEALAVPWHYRAAGDHRRHLGRWTLPLRDEPQSYTDDPSRAALIFIEGLATDVQRELTRLGRAGANFTSRTTPKDSAESSLHDLASEEQIEPIAIITIVDPDEQLLFDRAHTDEHIKDLLPTLPRPFLRPPSGHLTHRHLTSELTQYWTEVQDLLEVFGNGIAPLLRDLTRQGAILLDERTTLERGRKNYEKRVYLRGLEAELSPQRSTTQSAHDLLLPPPVEDVEVAARQHVSIGDRTTLTQLGRIDAESARQLYYIGRIFETARGRYIVVDHAGTDAKDSAFDAGDIIAEPFLGAEISSPRRTTKVQILTEDDAPRHIFLGDLPIGVGLFPVQCQVEHKATFRLHPRSAQIRQRIYLPEEERTPSTLNTQALAIYPTIPLDGAHLAEPLTLNAARQIAATLRAVLPLIYRGARSAMALAIHTDADPTDQDARLASTDAFFLFDLHSQGNGAARAIERDGIAPLLRLAHHLLSNLQDTARLLALHDDFDNPMPHDERLKARHTALRWFAHHLDGVAPPEEPAKQEEPEEPNDREEQEDQEPRP